MNLGGVDGCKAGWVIARYIQGKYDLELYKDFKSLIHDNKHLDRILIDIPVGLSSIKFKRTIDSVMRSELKHRRSTVFNAPSRLAVYEKDNEKAKSINQEIENKSLSIQSLAIRDKIKQVDEYLYNKKSNVEIIESHPELCFKYLNQDILQTIKSKSNGIEERLKIIQSFEPALVDLYKYKLLTIRRKDAKRDDLIDAICLCLVNKLGFENNLSYLIDDNAVDDLGIEVKIGYFRNGLK
ncbi:MAG: DUF429 domain-containing protein [Saprospiraceae bacterium]|nr:DUF429 domain-containing protein [Bacteroidia bacterium]NNF22707.1 DUF429 domain-containing protein [Saprospiraceae bacterium]